MTTNQLECFLTLAHQLNYTQAANDLFMTQPALSRTISALEQEMKVQLFYRNSRSVSLTPAGEAFLRECPAILDSYRYSLDAAQLAQQGFAGHISVGMLRDDFNIDMVKIYRTMSQKYPQINLTLREYSHSDLIRRFISGDLDAIVNTGLSGDFDLDALRPQCDSLCFCRNQQCAIVADNSPLALRPHIRMEELKNEDFVIMSRSASRPGHDFLWKAAVDAGFVPKVVAEASHVPSLLTMVACGIGISTLSSDLEHMGRSYVRFVPLMGVPFSVEELIWQKSCSNPSLPLLVKTVKEDILPFIEKKSL